MKTHYGKLESDSKYRRDYALNQAQRMIETAISATKTGEIRNKLTDVNIMLLSVMEDMNKEDAS